MLNLVWDVIEWTRDFSAEKKELFGRFMEKPLAEMQSPCKGDLPAILREAAEAIAAIRFDR